MKLVKKYHCWRGRRNEKKAALMQKSNESFLKKAEALCKKGKHKEAAQMRIWARGARKGRRRYELKADLHKADAHKY